MNCGFRVTAVMLVVKVKSLSVIVVLTTVPAWEQGSGKREAEVEAVRDAPEKRLKGEMASGAPCLQF